MLCIRGRREKLVRGKREGVRGFRTEMRMKSFTVVVVMTLVLATGAWGHSAKSVGELAGYLRADREQIR